MLRRLCDPALGRFAQADSILILPPGIQGLDRYAYVNNSPMMFNDPSGHEPKNGEGACYEVGCKNANGTTRSPGNGEGGRSGGDDEDGETEQTSHCAIPKIECLSTPTSTPTITPTPWKPVGQETGEKIANALVKFGENAFDFCFGYPNGYAGDGCGKVGADLGVLKVRTGTVFDFLILGIPFSYSASTTMIVGV